MIGPNQELTMTESNIPQSDGIAPDSASSPDDLVKDLEVKIPEGDADSIIGGRKAGKGQQEYLIVTLKEASIT